MEGDKVRLGLNILGRGVAGDERCTEMRAVSCAFMPGLANKEGDAADTQHVWTAS